jgi:membrane-associated phospholipid phosphatase
MVTRTRATLTRWSRAVTQRTLLLLAGAVVASVVFTIIARELRNPWLDQLDKQIELAVHKLDSVPADLVAAAASFIGSNVVLLPVVMVLAAVCALRHMRVAAVVLVTDTGFVILLDLYLKSIFARARPQLFDKIPLPTDYSFPSGHSMSAVGVWGVIAAVMIALCPAHRRAIVVAAVTLILAIGLSRIYFGVHWPFDVFGGFLAGLPPLIVSVHLIHRRKATHDRNVAEFVEAAAPQGPAE